jgi:trehalose 6-phosphate synthase/phosphatase
MQTNTIQTGDLVESPRPLGPQRNESVHPGLHPSVTEVPVTPGIHLGEYNSGSNSQSSYFSDVLGRQNDQMAQSPSEAASGAQSGGDLLRRISLKGHAQKQESLNEVDPKAANPALSLSGSVISATFCIPHSVEHRQGADWVSGNAGEIVNSRH